MSIRVTVWAAAILAIGTTVVLLPRVAHAEQSKSTAFPGARPGVTECSLRDLRYGLTNCLPAQQVARLPLKDVVAKVKAAGYKDIFSVEFEHGRYEIEALNRHGRKVLVIVDPRNGRVRLKSYGWTRLTGSFLSAEEIIAEVRDAGYTDVYSIGREHGLYEVVARDPDGSLAKLSVHAKTGRLIRRPRSGRPFAMPVLASDAAGEYASLPGILAKLDEAGYTEVYSLEPKRKLYQCVARDSRGQLALFLIDPRTGAVSDHP